MKSLGLNQKNEMKNLNFTSQMILAVVFMVALCDPALAVNKCKDKNGGTFYQDLPCDGGVKVVIHGDGESGGLTSDPDQLKIESLRRERRAAINSAIARGRVAVGMTAEEARGSWGSPTKINTSIGSYGKHEQWIYDRGNFVSQYVYIENGKVTAIQSPQ